MKEKLLENSQSIVRRSDAVSSHEFVVVDLVVVTTLHRLITKEMDFLEYFALDMSQTIRFVPASRENVERDLTTDRVRQIVVAEFGTELFHQFGADVMDLVVIFKLVSLGSAINSVS
jgi:hypothetical protein